MDNSSNSSDLHRSHRYHFRSSHPDSPSASHRRVPSHIAAGTSFQSNQVSQSDIAFVFLKL